MRRVRRQPDKRGERGRSSLHRGLLGDTDGRRSGERERGGGGQGREASASAKAGSENQAGGPMVQARAGNLAEEMGEGGKSAVESGE